ncbi:MAG TPA: tetratricopeptide repeat protein, partial [Rhodoferax sp.]|nr:tetratricopeptide repeat protein [Rhodoferax sp.]
MVFSTLLVALLLGCSEKPEAMLSSAKDYLAKNDSKAAVIQIKNALQSNPNLPEARFMLGTALLNSGDPVGAETELRKALELNYSPDLVMPQLASAMLAQGQAKKLTDELGQVTLGDAGAKASLQTSLAVAYSQQGRAEPSEAALRAALAADPGYVPALLVQARQQAARRDFDGALASAEEAIAKSPTSFEAWKLKGDLLLYVKNQPAEA